MLDCKHVNLQELAEEKTVASTNLATKSVGALASRGSMGVTRSELKRAELKRAKSMAYK